MLPARVLSGPSASVTIDNIDTTIDAIGRKYKKQVIDVNKLKS